MELVSFTAGEIRSAATRSWTTAVLKYRSNSARPSGSSGVLLAVIIWKKSLLVKCICGCTGTWFQKASVAKTWATTGSPAVTGNGLPTLPGAMPGVWVSPGSSTIRSA